MAQAGNQSTRTKRGNKPQATPAPKPKPVGSEEVPTLAEAAAYLRLSDSAVVCLIHTQDLPGRLAAGQWRLLKSAIDDWLRVPPPKPSKEAVLARIGSWKDDPYLEDELREIYRRRRGMRRDG
jgi:excisionase family DNA binding protein